MKNVILSSLIFSILLICRIKGQTLEVIDNNNEIITFKFTNNTQKSLALSNFEEEFVDMKLELWESREGRLFYTIKYNAVADATVKIPHRIILSGNSITFKMNINLFEGLNDREKELLARYLKRDSTSWPWYSLRFRIEAIDLNNDDLKSNTVVVDSKMIQATKP